jgi:6,7-dimethyl-8-ribityllumazine synthase
MANANSTVELQPGDRLAIVVSRYHREMTDDMLRGAQHRLSELGWAESQVDVVFVPGAWEIPLAVQRIAQTKRYAAIIALGVVIRGQSTHDRHINRFVSLSIGKLSLQYGLPIAFGLLTCKSAKQALRRADPKGHDKGGEAASAAVEMIRVLRSIRDESP